MCREYFWERFNPDGIPCILAEGHTGLCETADGTVWGDKPQPAPSATIDARVDIIIDEVETLIGKLGRNSRVELSDRLRQRLAQPAPTVAPATPQGQGDVLEAVVFFLQEIDNASNPDPSGDFMRTPMWIRRRSSEMVKKLLAAQPHVQSPTVELVLDAVDAILVANGYGVGDAYSLKVQVRQRIKAIQAEAQ